MLEKLYDMADAIAFFAVIGVPIALSLFVYYILEKRVGKIGALLLSICIVVFGFFVVAMLAANR